MIGLGTYAYFWRHQASLPDGSTGPAAPLDDLLRRTRALDVDVFQVCDYAPLLAFSAAELRELRSEADDLGIRLQLGTKGVAPDHLASYLHLADALGADLVRSMLFAPDSRPTLAEAERMLRTALPAFEAAGVTLALETYEQVPSADLVALVESIGSERLGVCLDAANGVAALEDPRDIVERCAPLVKNLHVKDFAFTRQAGWVGFALAGAPLGEGLLDVGHLLATVAPTRRGITSIVEHWLPWQGSLDATLTLEDAWTGHSVAYLKEHLS